MMRLKKNDGSRPGPSYRCPNLGLGVGFDAELFLTSHVICPLNVHSSIKMKLVD